MDSNRHGEPTAHRESQNDDAPESAVEHDTTGAGAQTAHGVPVPHEVGAVEEKPGTDSESITVTTEKAMNLAVWLHRSGRLAESERIYLAILKNNPCHPDALHYLGVLRHQLGTEGSLELIRASLQFAPENTAAWSNLGNLLRAADDRDAALDAYRRASALDPRNASAWNNIGVVLKELGRMEEAREAYERAIEIDPEHPEAYGNLGHVYRRLGRIADAVNAYAKAIAMRPDGTAAWNLAYSLHLAGQTDRAVTVVRDWSAQEPDNPVAIHLLAALSGDAVPARASDAYIRSVFDGFAETFDSKLESLKYKAPELVARAAARGLGTPEPTYRVLDAGCGTGLCGPLLKPHAARLTGVDLSPAMIARANARAVFDELVVAEITEYLATRTAAFDLIVSADTLCYFGDLGPVLAGIERALSGGGLVIFTLEDAGEEVPATGFRLNFHGRYCHGEGHVRETLAQAGLEILEIASAVLRFEAGAPVAGLIVTAQKPVVGKSLSS